MRLDANWTSLSLIPGLICPLWIGGGVWGGEGVVARSEACPDSVCAVRADQSSGKIVSLLPGKNSEAGKQNFKKLQKESPLIPASELKRN